MVARGSVSTILELMKGPALALICFAGLALAQENTAAPHDRVVALVGQGRYADAEPLLRSALEAREDEFGSENPGLLPAIGDLAALYRAMGRNADAEKLYLRSIQIREKALGPQNSALIPDLKLLGSLYAAMGRIPDAERQYMRAVSIRIEAQGTWDPDLAKDCLDLANFYLT